MSMNDLQSILHHDIPLTQAMGLQVLEWNGGCLKLRLPLGPNVNHKSTMFGGSLYCGAVLAGWGWLHLSLRDAGIGDGHIVIQQGQIDYPLPVIGDAIAVCGAPETEVWARFVSMFERYGRARLPLETQVFNEGGDAPAVRFSGQYVLTR